MATVGGGGGTPQKSIKAAQTKVKADRLKRVDKAYAAGQIVRHSRIQNPVADREVTGWGSTSGPGNRGKVYVQKPKGSGSKGAPAQPAYNPLPGNSQRTSARTPNPKFNPSVKLDASQIQDRRNWPGLNPPPKAKIKATPGPAPTAYKKR